MAVVCLHANLPNFTKLLWVYSFTVRQPARPYDARIFSCLSSQEHDHFSSQQVSSHVSRGGHEQAANASDSLRER